MNREELLGLKLSQLREIAGEKNMENISKLRKGELIDANRRLEEELELAKAEIEELKAQLAEVLCSVSGIYKTSADTVEAAADTMNDAYEKLKASARQIRNTAPAMEDNDHEDL